jgi:hypothetical protein
MDFFCLIVAALPADRIIRNLPGLAPGLPFNFGPVAAQSSLIIDAAVTATGARFI